MIRSRSVIPALKDQVKHMGMGLGSNIPTAEKSVMFFNRFYDYQIVGMVHTSINQPECSRSYQEVGNIAG